MLWRARNLDRPQCQLQMRLTPSEDSRLTNIRTKAGRAFTVGATQQHLPADPNAPTLDRMQAEPARAAPRRRSEPLLAPALTILLSSFLLFLVQPILAKQILPWFGGSAGVWTICLVFFQVVLLLGYTYAHWLTHRVGARQFVFHILLLLASCLTLPIIPGSSWRHAHGVTPELQILGLLATTVGPPYFLLASTAPLLQRWLSGSLRSPTPERSIYRLFALSNLGSLLGLLSYPFSIEPFVSVHAQVWAWSCAYVLFAACSISYAWRRRQLPHLQYNQSASGTARHPAPSPGAHAFWIGCSALGSTLLLGGTNQLTQNVASIPLLWIVPLSLYLASFALCFEGRSGRGWYERRLWLTPAMLATGAMAWALFADRAPVSVYVSLPVFTLGIFLGCMVCHGELARSKPNPDHLTHFYLSLAIGGALGGMLVGLVAPQVFNGYWEMPLALLALALLGLYCCSEEIRRRSSTSWMANVAVASLATALILLLLGALFSTPSDWAKIVQGDARWGCAALLIVSAVLLQRYRLWRAVALTALFCTMTFGWRYYHNLSVDTEFSVRNFYGTLRVSKPDRQQVRLLKHGVIEHGSQATRAPQRDEPTTYYGRSSGVGRTILSKQRTLGPLRIGSIGLGAGTLASYGRPGDLIRIYELNPAVLEIARNRFTYLTDSKARIEPVLGDARLSLEFELAHGAFDKPEQRFDVLSLDAFSGDAIPVHLLTREAFATYTRVTKPDGIIAFHVSNRYLDLAPVIERIAREAGFRAVLVADRPTTLSLTVASDWVLVTRNATFLRQPEIAAYSTPIVPRPRLPVWTDEFASLIHVLK
jgi:SAM-dependent methyltransferase